MADTVKRRSRRQFTDEFEGAPVRRVPDEGKTMAAVARDLDLTETALREWVKRVQTEGSKGTTGLSATERDELAHRVKRIDSCGSRKRS